MQQVKNINKTDKHIHSHKKRYLEVISRFTRFKEFNGEKKTATKTSNMFKIVPRIGTCDAGFSSSKFRSSCLPFVVKQTTLPVSSQLLLSRTTVDSNFFHGPIEFEITRVNCIRQLHCKHFTTIYYFNITFKTTTKQILPKYVQIILHVVQ